jgi:hypothetical protein
MIPSLKVYLNISPSVFHSVPQGYPWSLLPSCSSLTVSLRSYNRMFPNDDFWW